MTFTSTPITVLDGAATSKSMIAYNDGTSSALAHPLLDATGAIISPATSGNQTTANSSLATIATNTTGAATSALQTTGNTSLASIATNTSGVATAANQSTGNTALSAIQSSVANIPSSAATAALQTTGNTSLASIATNTTGAATSAKQDTGNTSLAALVTNTSGVATAAKQDTGNASLATIATATTAIATAAGLEATAALQTTGNSSLSTIATNTAGLATAAAQTTAAGKLDTIIANTGAGSVNLTNTPTVTAGAYTTGMVAGGKQSLANAVRSSGGSGIIQSVSVTKKTALTAAYDVYFFHTDPTNSTFTDNSALALNVADIPFLIGVVRCTDLVSNGTPQTLQANNVGLPFKLATGTTLFAVAVIRGAETLASTSAIILNVGILQD